VSLAVGAIDACYDLRRGVLSEDNAADLRRADEYILVWLAGTWSTGWPKECGVIIPTSYEFAGRMFCAMPIVASVKQSPAGPLLRVCGGRHLVEPPKQAALVRYSLKARRLDIRELLKNALEYADRLLPEAS
jgi:hypothetical protein